MKRSYDVDDLFFALLTIAIVGPLIVIAWKAALSW